MPRHFTEDRPERIVSLVRAAGVGHLVTNGPDGFESTPVPFVVDDDCTQVRAHLARPNPMWRLAPIDAVLIVPVTDAYISPSWYPSKVEHGKVVPTWNYEVVHLHGRLVAHDDAEWIAAQIRELTELHEAPMPSPWSVDDPPDGYIGQLARGIVGVELIVERVDAKRKLSQNKSVDDREGAIEGLRTTNGRGAADIAAAMRKTGIDD